MNDLNTFETIQKSSKFAKIFQGLKTIFDFGHRKNVHFSKVHFKFRKNLDFLNSDQYGKDIFQGFLTYGLKSFQ